MLPNKAQIHDQFQRTVSSKLVARAARKSLKATLRSKTLLPLGMIAGTSIGYRLGRAYRGDDLQPAKLGRRIWTLHSLMPLF